MKLDALPYKLTWTETYKYRRKIFIKNIEDYYDEGHIHFQHCSFNPKCSNIKLYYNNKLIRECKKGGPNCYKIFGNNIDYRKTKCDVPDLTKYTDIVHSIVSVSFGCNNKTYDYLLNNRSKQRIVKDQIVTLITGGSNNQTIQIKHLNKVNSIPPHVTKSLIITTPTTAIVGLLPKGGN